MNPQHTQEDALREAAKEYSKYEEGNFEAFAEAMYLEIAKSKPVEEYWQVKNTVDLDEPEFLESYYDFMNKAYQNNGDPGYDGIFNFFKPHLMKTEGKEGSEAVDRIIDSIKDLELMIPIERFFDKNGNSITKKEYGKVLLEILVVELKAKFNRP